jgi:hypothetical protein
VFLLMNRNNQRMSSLRGIRLRLLLMCLFLFGGVWGEDSSPSDTYMDPTASELERGYVLRPASFWGRKMRKEHSLRLLALGSSNALFASRPGGFLDLLQPYIESLSGDSYIMNIAISGGNPNNFKDMEEYPFSVLLWPGEKWPNVVLLEFSMTMGSWSVLQGLETVVLLLKRLYHEKGLPPPDFLYVDLFSVQAQIETMPTNDTVTNRIKHLYETLLLSKSVLMPTRGSEGGALALDLCRFYGFPMLSSTDALFPAFLRWYLRSPSPLPKYKFADDGRHFSAAGSAHMAFILKSFFESEMARVETPAALAEPAEMYEDRHITLTPIGDESLAVQSWTSWGGGENTLKSIVRVDPESGAEWTHTPNHDDGLHRCYGVRKNDTTVAFDFVPDKRCEGGCRALVFVLRSWNSTAVGRIACSLQNENGEVVGGWQPINLTAGAKFTMPKGHRFGQVVHPGEKHSVVCRTEDDKLACFTGIKLVKSISVLDY